MNLANSLTVLRLLLIPFFGYCLAQNHGEWALTLFAIGAATDFLDGLVARLLDQKTRLGAILDPIADKLMLHVAYGAAMMGRLLPFWPWSILLARDFAQGVSWVIVVVFLKRVKARTYAPSRLGKYTTAAHVMAIVLLLLARGLERPELWPHVRVFVLWAAWMTFVTTLQYIGVGIASLRQVQHTE
jgi:cardiolipin synthase